MQFNESAVFGEIVLIDDASEIKFRKTNEQLSKLDNVSYIQLEKNIGRSKIRNLFLSHASFDYLLFLDCDSLVYDAKFIENYLNLIEKKHPVICGGRSYSSIRPPKTHYLRWKYGLARECLPAKRRGKNPHRSFMTNNFVIHAKVLSKIQFDERITQYGHEDTLFGYRLKQNKVPIMHINNPVQHLFTESNVEFLEKTELGLKNLVEIRKFVNDKGFDNEIKILRIYRKISRFGLKYVLFFASFLAKPILFRLLKNGNGGLFFFDLYKFLFFLKQTLIKPVN